MCIYMYPTTQMGLRSSFIITLLPTATRLMPHDGTYLLIAMKLENGEIVNFCCPMELQTQILSIQGDG